MNKELIIKLGTTFYFCSILGYIYELLLNYYYTNKFFSHGILKGPWLPIYGFGALLIYPLKKYQDEPWKIFLISFIITGVFECLSGFLLLKLFKMRRWDYTGYLFNIGGYVCLLSATCFGVGGLLYIYLIEPFINKLISKIDINKMKYILSGISGFFISDLIATKLK